MFFLGVFSKVYHGIQKRASVENLTRFLLETIMFISAVQPFVGSCVRNTSKTER